MKKLRIKGKCPSDLELKTSDNTERVIDRINKFIDKHLTFNEDRKIVIKSVSYESITVYSTAYNETEEITIDFIALMFPDKVVVDGKSLDLMTKTI